MGPALANARPPYVARLTRGKSSSPGRAERRWRRPGTLDMGWHCVDRYPGAMLCRHLYTWTHTLNRTRSSASSQWSSCRQFGAPQQISTVFACWLRYCTDVAQRRSTKICTMFGRFLGWYTIYMHFWGKKGLLPPNGILSGAKFTLRPSLAFSYIGSVTARHSSSGRQPNFAALCKEWNYGTFTEGATYIRLGGHYVGHRPTF